MDCTISVCTVILIDINNFYCKSEYLYICPILSLSKACCDDVALCGSCCMVL